MLQGSWAEAARNNLPLSCLMIDLDGFKALNDRMGHHRGDEVLRLAAKVIRANSRAVDVPARYGGDEFCVLMAHTEAEEAMLVAERILREFRHATRLAPEEEPPMGMSIGVSHINLSRPISGDQLVTHADEALYAAKQAGKNRVMLRESSGVTGPAAIVG
jgi:diguanylate cyclase (GGDEF)-like protein